MGDALKLELDANYDFFARRLGGLLEEHANQYALLKSKAIIAFYDRPGDAYRVGLASFPDEIFSVQKVTDEIDDLGFMSFAVI